MTNTCDSLLNDLQGTEQMGITSFYTKLLTHIQDLIDVFIIFKYWWTQINGTSAINHVLKACDNKLHT